jgi:putative acetyltransferase
MPSIRCELSSDLESIRRLHEVAFGNQVEGRLVDALRATGDLVLSLVALDGARPVGHVAFSRMQAPFRALGLGPVSVQPERQRRGIGSQLIRTGLTWAKNESWEGVFVVGDPTFYQRFGFSAEQAGGFRSRYSGPYLMALSLAGTQLPVTSGEIEYAPAFAALE